MKRKRFTEEQIIGVLGEQEPGAKGADLALKQRDLGSDALQLEGQAWRHGRFDAKRLKALDDETAKLKKLLAEQMLDAAALRELLAKNVWSAPSVQGFATSQMTIPVA